MVEQTFKSYLLTLGEFDTEMISTFEKQVFIFATFFATVVMLNLVIALMSDAYEEVMNEVDERDAYETNQMIIEAEIMHFSKRDSGKPGYLYYVDYAMDKIVDWKSQVSYITQTLTGA